MDSLPKVLLERLSIVVEVVAFFLAAPEILGDHRLKAIERWLLKRIEEGSPAVIMYISTILVIVAALGILDIILSILHISANTPLPLPVGVVVTFFLFSSLVLGVLLGQRVVMMLIPQVHRLAEDERGRRRWLVMGTGLFLVAQLMNFLATFLR